MYNKEEFENDLDNLLQKRDTLTCKEIDAGCCGTSLDFKKKHIAEEAFLNERDKFLAKYQPKT